MHVCGFRLGFRGVKSSRKLVEAGVPVRFCARIGTNGRHRGWGWGVRRVSPAASPGSVCPKLARYAGTKLAKPRRTARSWRVVCAERKERAGIRRREGIWRVCYVRNATNPTAFADPSTFLTLSASNPPRSGGGMRFVALVTAVRPGLSPPSLPHVGRAPRAQRLRCWPHASAVLRPRKDCVGDPRNGEYWT
jgi:hypothetical protein